MDNIRKKKKIILLSIIIAIVVLLIILMLWGNLTIETSHYEVKSSILPLPFDGYKIAHISDLHNYEYGKDNKKIIDILQSQSPDIIAITGDLVDSNKTDIDIAIRFIEQAIKIAPCYYVTGNHEAGLPYKTYKQLENSLIELGVNVLNDECILLQKEGSFIQLIGLNDPNFNDTDASVQADMFDKKLKSLEMQEGFKILLSHRPELFEVYAENDIDLILSGHAHGGQFRMPFVGGVYVPNQGFFPKYDAGLIQQDNTNMIISRGIGNSVIPIRINNRPEVVIITLRAVNG